MDPSILLEKILELEKELLKLKSELPNKSERQSNFKKVKAAVDGVLSYWVPLALIIGLLVNWWFGVGIFEDIKNIGINKTSSHYYRELGDKLMSHAEFAAAAESFKKALEINSNNIDATHGLLKAEALQAGGNSRSFNPVVIRDKLTHLRGIFEKEEDDYILLYWEGLLQRQLSSTPAELAKPESSFLQSINKKPNFPGSHLELGNTYLLAGDIDKAIKKFEDVINLDPGFAGALSNLGYCRFVLSNFQSNEKSRQQVLRTAAEHLESARSSMPLPETDLRLGDTYLLMNQYRAAKVAHQNALDSLEQSTEQKARESFEVLFLFPPTSLTETHERDPALKVTTNEQLKLLTLYSLSFDWAGLKDFKKAQEYFNKASTLDAKKQFSPLIALQINSLLRSPAITSNTRAWLLSHMKKLCSGVDACLPEVSQPERKQK
jgi:tetratricopeptide (TPR) repeat protein